MPRVKNLGTVVRESAEEVADLFERLSEDGITADEVDLVLHALNRHVAATERTEAALTLIACVSASGTETRRAREHIKEWTVLQGGLAEMGPGAA